MLGDLHVVTYTMRCAHGSGNEIFSECDPGPTYVVQRLWHPGGPNYTSRSSFLVNLEKLGKPKTLPRLHPVLSHPSLVILMLILLPKLHLGKVDDMGNFRYTPRLEQ